MKILFVENDMLFVNKLKILFEKNNVHVQVAKNGEECILKMQEFIFDVILLDKILPDIDGSQLISIIRSKGYNTPIIMLSAVGILDGKIAAIEQGADDYITKPCYFSEVLARLKAANRRSNYKAYNNIVKVGNLNIDTTNRLVTTEDNQVVNLTNTEFKILEILIRNRGRVVSKDLLMQYIYEENNAIKNIPKMKIVDVFMCKLRKKIKTASQQSYVETCWGFGYRLQYQTEGQIHKTTRITDDAKPIMGIAFSNYSSN